MKLKVPYLFAGEHRKCSVKEVLNRILGKNEGEAWRRLFVIELVCDEWDILRGEDYDLSDAEVQDKLCRKVEGGTLTLWL